MYQDHPSQLSGPDFLDQVADIAAGHDELINADEYRRRAQQWKADQVELEFTRQRCRELENQLAAVRTASHLAAGKTGAVTPTDQRH